MLTVVDSRLVGADWVIPKRVSVSEPITVNLSLSMGTKRNLNVQGICLSKGFLSMMLRS